MNFLDGILNFVKPHYFTDFQVWPKVPLTHHLLNLELDRKSACTLQHQIQGHVPIE